MFLMHQLPNVFAIPKKRSRRYLHPMHAPCAILLASNTFLSRRCKENGLNMLISPASEIRTRHATEGGRVSGITF